MSVFLLIMFVLALVISMNCSCFTKKFLPKFMSNGIFNLIYEQFTDTTGISVL